MTLTLDRAHTIIDGALASAEETGLQPLSVAVLDTGGHLIAFARQDGSSNGRFQIAYGKAYGALALGVGSRALMARAEVQPYFVTAVTAALGGSLIPVPGGVLIRDTSETLLGAVGVTGDTSDEDEAAASAGIVAARLVADTGG